MEFRKIMEYYKKEGYDYVQEKYGGVLELCRYLYILFNEGYCLDICVFYLMKVIVYIFVYFI